MSQIAILSAGKREQTKVANRQAILDAARAVFADLGYEVATVRDIIGRTGLASGTFYNYFRSKEEVFDALADDGVRRFRPILRAQCETAHGFEAFVRQAITAYFTFLAQEHATWMRRGAADAGPEPRHTPEMTAVFEEVRSAFSRNLEHEQMPDVDLDFLTAAAIAVAREIGDKMLEREPMDVAKAADFAVALIMGGLPALPRTTP